MILATFENFPDYELLDTGSGYRLERWGEVVLQRPDPQVIWQRSLPETEWHKAWAIFRSGKNEDSGKWDIKKALPEPWMVNFHNIKFLLKLTPFKHTGLFAEQAAQWEWLIDKLKVHKVIKSGPDKPDLKVFRLDDFKLTNKFKVLNLFGYTGGATMVLARAGCFVTHVDASKPAIDWANKNHALNRLPKDSVRWILDDAVKFAKRELKRGAQYDGIIMDPPAFGHSPSGKTWKFNRDLPELLADCVRLLSNDAKFLIINGYATNSSALSLQNVLEDTIKDHDGKIESGELCLKQKHLAQDGAPAAGRLISTGIFARWSSSDIRGNL